MKRAWVVAAAITLAAVAALFVLFLASSRGRGHTPQDQTRHTLWVLADVLEQYREEHGRYPGNDERLEVLVREGFIRKLPIDPWGNPYQYRFPGSQESGRFDLWSTGADGRTGGEGEDADITKWDDQDWVRPVTCRHRYLADSDRGVRDYQKLPGNRGVCLLKRDQGAYDRECLLDPEPVVEHYEVLVAPGAGTA